jgi:hypothetical protein
MTPDTLRATIKHAVARGVGSKAKWRCWTYNCAHCRAIVRLPYVTGQPVLCKDCAAPLDT